MGAATLAWLQVTSDCGPVAEGADAFTLACGGSLQTVAHGVLYVVAVAVLPDGGEAEILLWDLQPGAPPVVLPPPPAGAVWVVATQTAAAARRQADWALAWGLVVAAMAGVGLGTLAVDAWRAVRGRRRY